MSPDVTTTSSALKSGNILGAMGLGNFNFGIGTLGTILIWIFMSLIVVGFVIAIVIWIIYKKNH